MIELGPSIVLGFAQPWLLLALAALPVLWILLRALPPPARERRFAAILLLLGLPDRDREARRSPRWLLMLRMAALAAAILGFAGPVLNPPPPGQGAAGGPLLILTDGGWADAPDWPTRAALIDEALAAAGREGRKVAMVSLADKPFAPAFSSAAALSPLFAARAPAPHLPAQIAEWAGALPAGRFDSLWISDGLDHLGREALHAALAGRGTLRVMQPARPLYALAAPRSEGGALAVTLLRPLGGQAQRVEVAAIGPDPAGVERDLARTEVALGAGATRAEARIPLPVEVMNRVTRLALPGHDSAGAVALAGDSLRRRKVALAATGPAQEGLLLLDQSHYLRQALVPTAELVEGSIDQVLPTRPDVVILTDVARLSPPDAEALQAFVEGGGLLLRFAGPRLAAAGLLGEGARDDPLMPVRLRAGGRDLGGAMSWGAPRALAPFGEGSPFQGLAVPDEVTVSRQVLAQPDPELPGRTIAALADGTPLVTRRALGAGQVVLFHVTANAEWSSLPLSGLFPHMLGRLAVTAGTRAPAPEVLAGRPWRPVMELDGSGRPRLVEDGMRGGVDGAALGLALRQGPGPGLPPGLYRDDEMTIALNALTEGADLRPARWPAGQVVETGRAALPARNLMGLLLATALVLALGDLFATLALVGGLRLPRGAGGALSALLLALALTPDGRPALAQEGSADDSLALRATEGVVLAHVLTGDPELDRLAETGLASLSARLAERTSVEPLPPLGVDPERDELAFFPFLYWPVTPDQPQPSPQAYARLNAFLRTGGMILFDTRDGDIAGDGVGAPTAEGAALQRLAAGLDIPPLAPMAQDHILTRSFYLIGGAPGRHENPTLWVEAPPPGAESSAATALQSTTDGVTPVVIGGNDWASAWATDDWGVGLYPVGRGAGGERQREMAVRFGINLVMHVLTGNYKSDQVHVPALLERLGE